MPDKQIPRVESELVPFFVNFQEKLVTYGPSLGISPTEIAMMANHVANLTFLINVNQQVADTREAFTDFKQTMLYGDVDGATPPTPAFPAINLPEAGEPGIITYAKLLIRKMKSTTKYTNQMAEEFGLWSDHPSPDPESNMPVLTATALPLGELEVRYRKNGRQGIQLEWRFKGESEWKNLGRWTTSPIKFTPPSETGQPQIVEFRARYTEKDSPVGNFSAVITVVTTP